MKLEFEQVVEMYWEEILGYLWRMYSGAPEAEDSFQETFLRAFKAYPQLDRDANVRAWLYRIAINTAKNHLVARGRRPPGVDVDVEDAEHFETGAALREGENPENHLFSQELGRVVNRAISNLPDDLRTAVTLREFDGLSYEDIAEIMDCPVGTVRSRIFRAREAIDKQVQAQLDGENALYGG